MEDDESDDESMDDVAPSSATTYPQHRSAHRNHPYSASYYRNHVSAPAQQNSAAFWETYYAAANGHARSSTSASRRHPGAAAASHWKISSQRSTASHYYAASDREMSSHTPSSDEAGPSSAPVQHASGYPEDDKIKLAFSTNAIHGITGSTSSSRDQPRDWMSSHSGSSFSSGSASPSSSRAPSVVGGRRPSSSVDYHSGGGPLQQNGVYSELPRTYSDRLYSDTEPSLRSTQVARPQVRHRDSATRSTTMDDDYLEDENAMTGADDELIGVYGVEYADMDKGDPRAAPMPLGGGGFHDAPFREGPSWIASPMEFVADDSGERMVNAGEMIFFVQ